MMYIFEGVDHSGKDSLINTLRRFKNIPVFDGSNAYDQEDCPPLVEDPVEFQKAIGWEIVQFCKQTNYDVIINRFTWSEIVYSLTLKRSIDLNWYLYTMEKELQSVAKIIYVHAPVEVILDRINSSQRKKSDLIRASIPSLLKEYDRLIAQTKIPVYKVNTDGLDLNDLDLMDKLQKEIFI